jgi:predicted RNA-binding protein with PUA-like domain
MPCWLMKSEPDDVSIDDLAARPGQTVPWYGVRNYQARNFMRDLMRIGDGVLFYHSGCAEPGIAGIARVASTAYPDATQFDPASKYFDPKSSSANPRWLHVDVAFVRKTRLVGLPELRTRPELANMRVLARGNRLSITPVTADEWRFIVGRLLGATDLQDWT